MLSEQEVTTKEYGFANYDEYKGDKIKSQTSTRIREATDFAKANFAELKSADRDKRVGYGGTWWLRSPDEHGGKFVRDINFEGNGHSNNQVNVKFTGVVPALCVKLE